MSSQPPVQPAAGSAGATPSSNQSSGRMLEAFLYDTTSSIHEQLLFSPSSACGTCIGVQRAEAAIRSFDASMADDSQRS